MDREAWARIARVFPKECAKRDEILEYIRIHPGGRFSELRAYFDTCDYQGLTRVLFQLHRDGAIVLDAEGHRLAVSAECPQNAPVRHFGREDVTLTEKTAKSGCSARAGSL